MSYTWENGHEPESHVKDRCAFILLPGSLYSYKRQQPFSKQTCPMPWLSAYYPEVVAWSLPGKNTKKNIQVRLKMNLGGLSWPQNGEFSVPWMKLFPGPFSFCLAWVWQIVCMKWKEGDEPRENISFSKPVPSMVCAHILKEEGRELLTRRTYIKHPAFAPGTKVWDSLGKALGEPKWHNHRSLPKVYFEFVKPK